MSNRCRWIILAAILATSCYSPDYPNNRQCTPDGSCPGDLVCNREFFCISPDLLGEPPPPPPETSYGEFCWAENPCWDGLFCYLDPNDGTGLGFCTAMCGDGQVVFDEGVCAYIDQNSPNTQCSFSDAAGLGPMYCGTFCERNEDCPPSLECREDEWVEMLICQTPPA